MIRIAWVSIWVGIAVWRFCMGLQTLDHQRWSQREQSTTCAKILIFAEIARFVQRQPLQNLEMPQLSLLLTLHLLGQPTEMYRWRAWRLWRHLDMMRHLHLQPMRMPLCGSRCARLHESVSVCVNVCVCMCAGGWVSLCAHAGACASVSACRVCVAARHESEVWTHRVGS